jgi:glucose-6-phosphate isomerase
MIETLKAAWDRLRTVHGQLEDVDLRQLFQQAGDRFAAFSRTAGDVTIDFSKQRIDQSALDALLALGAAAGVSERRQAMADGEALNVTEGRAARHMALRAPAEDDRFADVAADVSAVRNRFLAFADNVRSGRIAASDGAPFSDVINLGIGGSDLGPLLIDQALAPYRSGPRLHFVSNVDGAHLADTLKSLEPARTLVLVASKSFTTLETMMNAQAARSWIAGALGETAVAAHFAAISTNLTAVAEFGIADDRVFGFWDWVGGRYSLWSAIGLPIAIGQGPEAFEQLLAGAHAMDQHFLAAPLKDNLPVLMALIGIWNRNLEGHNSLALIPYDQRLARLPAYVQQLDMESNGKRVTLDGTPVADATAPIIWGEPGTNAQHAFFQMLHQGTTVVPIDFLIAANAHEDDPALKGHHPALLANCFAQSEALMFGETREEAEARLLGAGMSKNDTQRLAPHKTFPGNRPSTTILYPKLTPHVLGQLIALYEHKVFVQGTIWRINSFDQWGVELGKVLAREILPMLDGQAVASNTSTAGLIAATRRLRGTP